VALARFLAAIDCVSAALEGFCADTGKMNPKTKRENIVNCLK